MQPDDLKVLLDLIMSKLGSSQSYSSDINKLMELFAGQLGTGTTLPARAADPANPTAPGKSKTPAPTIGPTKVLVILALIAGALDVFSVLVDRNQTVQVVLSGSLRRKTRLDRMLDEIGGMPFDDVLRSVLGRFTS